MGIVEKLNLKHKIESVRIAEANIEYCELKLLSYCGGRKIET